MIKSQLDNRSIFERKVRAPMDKTPGNTWEMQIYGKCNRKNTAPKEVRLKWCGKSTPHKCNIYGNENPTWSKTK